MGRPRKPTITEVPRNDGTTVYRVRTRGRGKHGSETFASRAAARVFCENIIEFGDDEALDMLDRADRNTIDYVPTLAEALTSHIEELTGVDQRTKDDYLAMAELSWLNTLGRYPLDALTDTHIKRWINSEDGQVKPKTIKNRHSLLSATLEWAVHKGTIPRNVARGIRLPRTGEEDTEEIRYLTYAEFDRLLAATPDYWRPFVILLFGTGLRFSEATALQVRDINPDTQTLRVMRAWKREKLAPLVRAWAKETGRDVPPKGRLPKSLYQEWAKATGRTTLGGLRLGPPKSMMSRRTIALPHEVLDAIRPLLDRPGTEFLFTTTTGRVIMHSNFYNRIWAPTCLAAGIEPRPRIHDARHTHASWLIAQGARLEIVQERLGHEDYTTTRRVYAHLTPDLRAEAGRAASRAFASTSLGQIEA